MILVVNVLPVYIGNSSVAKIQSVITVCENFILIGFIAVLAVIFRHNMYFDVTGVTSGCVF